MWWRLIAALAMLATNGFFTASEFALIAARRTRVEQLARQGNMRARLALHASGELSLMLAGAQFGITLTALVLGWLAEPLAATAFEKLFGIVVPEGGGWVTGVSAVLGLLSVVFFHMTFAEMVPKNVAISRPIQTSLWTAVPFAGFVNLFRWLLRTLNAMANAGVRLMGVEPLDEIVAVYTPADLITVIGKSRAGGAIGEVEHRILSGALEFGELTAAEVMVPRTAVVAVPDDMTVGEVQQLVRHHGHSRIPVYEGDFDHVLGFVHAKDLLRPGVSPDSALPRRLVRDAWVVPEARRLFPLLTDMRTERRQFGLVVDEHGGTAGIITLEDILEELVGDIDDEYDMRRRRIRSVGPREWLCDAGLRPGEVVDPIGLVIPDGNYDTIRGFVLDCLGAIPEEGALVEHDGWTLRVATMNGRRVETVRITAPEVPGA